jgi:hypothetical protein
MLDTKAQYLQPYDELATTLEAKYNFFIFPVGSNNGIKTFSLVHNAHDGSVVPAVDCSYISLGHLRKR